MQHERETEIHKDIVDVEPAGEDPAGQDPKDERSPCSASADPHTPREIVVDCPYCYEAVLHSDPECTNCGKSLADVTLREEFGRLKSRRRLFVLFSFVFGVPGIVLIGCGAVYRAAHQGHAVPHPLLSPVLLGIGIVFLWLGIGCAVAYKRFNLAWMILALLGLPGLLILACIPDQKGKRLSRLRAILKYRRAAPRSASASIAG